MEALLFPIWGFHPWDADAGAVASFLVGVQGSGPLVLPHFLHRITQTRFYIDQIFCISTGKLHPCTGPVHQRRISSRGKSRI